MRGPPRPARLHRGTATPTGRPSAILPWSHNIPVLALVTLCLGRGGHRGKRSPCRHHPGKIEVAAVVRLDTDFRRY